jgi:hypothetical protein
VSARAVSYRLLLGRVAELEENPGRRLFDAGQIAARP